VVLIYGIVERFGYEGLAVATMMAGALLVMMGLMRLGAVIRFIPYPVTVGFTSGIALIIAAGQVRDALGLSMERVPSGFVEKATEYAAHIGTLHVGAFGLCAASIAIVQLWPRVTERVPGPLVALIAGTLGAHAMGLDVETIGSRFGHVSASLPMPRLPSFDWALLGQLASPALSIALLGGIESLLSAVVADGMTGRRHRSNAELVAQGVANLASPLFGGIPATGAIARTATNVRNGGRTPIAGIVHAATLLLLLLFAGSLAELIPLATLAGILLVVAYHMSEWRTFGRLLRGPRSDVLVLVTTFALTVLVDLTVAIQAGIVLAALLLMRRMAEVTQVRAITDQLRYSEGEDVEMREAPPAGVEVFEINGTFCFGAAQKFSEVMSDLRTRPRVVILHMRHVLAMDATGLKALEETAVRFQRQGAVLLLAGVHAQPLVVIERSGLLEKIGADNLLESYPEAVARARTLTSAT
jgi:SulP family sulfate permease